VTEGSTAVEEVCGFVPVDLYLWKLLASPGNKSSQKS